MAATVRSKVYPTLIQGVSQQAKQQRRDSQCEEQINCINSIVSGVEARNGGSLVASHFLHPSDDTVFQASRFFYRIRRGKDEQYIVVIRNGSLQVYNLLTGVQCAVSFPDGWNYLNLRKYTGLGGTSEFDGDGRAEDSFTAITIQDATIIANKTVRATGDGSPSTFAPTRPPEACFYFKAGGYSTKYSIAIRYNNQTYKWTYETPDNSTSGNAQYITTTQLAATFFRAMAGVTASSAGPGSGGLLQGDYAGHESGFTARPWSTLLPQLGFSMEIDGNVVRIWRPDDNNSFRISVTDGQGGRHLVAFRDSIENFADLPKSCFSGYVVKVIGADQTKDDDYFVRFTGNTGSDGAWLECPAPGIHTAIAASTMPHILQNEAPDVFTFKRASWGSRVAGDGFNTALDPSFLGQTIKDLYYDRSRLGILTESSLVWSRAKQPFVFFPDTVQTTLATDPVDLEINHKEIALLKRFVVSSGTRMAWADGAQFGLTTNEQTFKQETAEAIPMASYEFSDKAPPLSAGQLLFFGLDHGDFTSIKDVVVDRGLIANDNTTTAHVPRYLPGGFRLMAASDALNMLLVNCADAPNVIWVYQWLFTEEGRVQSAWSKWTFPSTSRVLWCGFTSSTLHVILRRPSALVFEEHDLSYLGRDSAKPVRLRLDHAFDHSRVTNMVYTVPTMPFVGIPLEPPTTSFTAPYSMSGVAPSDLVCVLETDTDEAYRGTLFDVVAVNGNTVTVLGDLTGKNFRCGFKITSLRKFSEFFEKLPDGEPITTESVILDRLTIFHGVTGYYRVQVETTTNTYNYEYEGRRLGEPSMGVPGLATFEGSFTAPISADSKETSITLINDTPYPSSWSAAEWFYQVQRSR